MASIMIWKFYNEQMRFYFDTSNLPDYVDRMELTYTMKDGLPVFDRKVETKDGLLEYTAGNFRGALSLIHSERSVNDVSFYDFFFDGHTNKFLINYFFSDTCSFQGFFTIGDHSKALTYSKGELSIGFQAFGPMRELADSYSLPKFGTKIAQEDYSLEEYVNFHFGASTVLQKTFPDTNYATRIGDSEVVFSGFMHRQMDASSFLGQIPRWGTYKELMKGTGSNFRVLMNQSYNFDQTRPSFSLNQLFIEDIVNEDAIDIRVIEHNEDAILNSKKWVFAAYRHRIQAQPNANVTYTQGIIFNTQESISIDYTDKGDVNWALNQTSFRFDPFNSRGLAFSDVEGISGYTPQAFDRESEIAGVDFTLYNHPEFGKFLAGSMSYASLMVSGGYNHLAVQNYLATSYRRYLLGDKKRKKLKIFFDGTQGLDLYRKLTLTDKDGTLDYYISAIMGIDPLESKTADIEATQL